VLSFIRSLSHMCDFPRDLREEATLGLFLLLFVMCCAAIAMQLHLTATRPATYTLECIDMRTRVRSTFYSCPSIEVKSEHAWCGTVRIASSCSGKVQD